MAGLRARGVHAFLVGEAFMSAPDPGERLAALFGDGEGDGGEGEGDGGTRSTGASGSASGSGSAGDATG